MGDFTASSYNTGDIDVQFYNDGGDRDVQVDYLVVDGSYRQAEDQSYNTAAYANGECGGGSYTEWMHCNGVIGFGDSGGGGGSTTTTSGYTSTTSGYTTTTSSSTWWGGSWWW
jgi:hypothetical protein